MELETTGVEDGMQKCQIYDVNGKTNPQRKQNVQIEGNISTWKEMINARVSARNGTLSVAPKACKTC